MSDLVVKAASSDRRVHLCARSRKPPQVLLRCIHGKTLRVAECFISAPSAA